MNRPLKIVLILVVLLIIAYLVIHGLSSRREQRMLPEGPQTLTGTLVPAGLSLTRRGTHVLEVDNEKITYVESPTVNLRLYELTEVGLTGVFQHNTDDAELPVLVVSKVQPVEISAESVDLPSVGLTLRVPRDWELSTFDDGVSFTLTGTTTPLLRILKSSLTRLPEGTPMFVAGFDAVRVSESGLKQTVLLQTNRGILTFTWSPSRNDPTLQAGFAQLLRTAIVRSSALSSQRTMTGAVQTSSQSVGSAGSAASNAKGQPCGGPAGKLCPSGFYCSVTELDGIGTCVQL